MTKKYIVDLKTEEQEMLTGLITSGTQRVRKVNHARILLKAADGWTDHDLRFRCAQRGLGRECSDH